MEQYLRELDSLLSEPLDSVRERERTEFDRVLAGSGGRLVLFGAGNFGRKALGCLRGAGIEPLAFADNSSAKWGQQVDGLPVLSPREAAEKFGASALFVVTIWSLGHSYHKTYGALENLGCTQITSSSSLRWKFARGLLPDYCQDLPHKVYEQADAVRRAMSLWADECSRREYLGQILWRATGNLAALQPPVGDQYFIDGTYSMAPHEVFIDCGAFDGDTARQVISRNPQFERILAIEPDPGNFVKLQHWVGSLETSVATRIAMANVAVGARKGRLSFRADGNEAAHLASDGNVMVECAPLDELLARTSPSILKMDVEGAEMEALEGGKETICRTRPVLTICAYHRFDDLWRLPIFIHSLVNDHRLFLRAHAVDGRELVCYAVPPRRAVA